MRKVIALPWKGGYNVPRRENPALEDSWFRPNGWNQIDDFNLANLDEEFTSLARAASGGEFFIKANLALGDDLPKGKYAER